VGVDNNNFTPISFDEVSRIITDQQLSLGMYSPNCSNHNYTEEDLKKVEQQ
jgi:hypothetical protein